MVAFRRPPRGALRGPLVTWWRSRFTVRLVCRALGAVAIVVAPACHASGIDPALVSQAAGESARRLEEDDALVVFGWQAEFVGDRLRWRGCASETSCAFQEREVAAGSVISVAEAGQATVAAPEGPRLVQVQRITLRR
jgi:hypothetical protein